MVLLFSVLRQWIARATGCISGPTFLVIASVLGFGVLIAPRPGAGQQLEPLNADAAAGDRYGFSVAIDGAHILVGSPRANDYGTSSGGVSAVRWTGQQWDNVQRLEVGQVLGGDQFGYDVAVDDNFAIVGAPGDDEEGNNAGAAYFFQWNDSTWIEQTKVTVLAAGQSAQFGHAVDISGNYAIVGAFGRTVSDTINTAGTAYIFVRDNSGWSRDTTLTAPQPAPGGHFGYSVALDGPRAVVGARGEQSSAGAAYIFERSAAEWGQPAILTAEEGAEGDEFGFSVDISGDRVLIGAWNEDTEATDAGAAYSFAHTSNGWEQERRWTADDTSAVEAGFGFAVAVDSNMAVIGSPRGDGWAPQSGVSYLYEYADDSWQQTQTFVPDSVALFGSSVDADAESGVLVGAWGSSENSGSAWLYNFAPEHPVARHDPELPREVRLAQNYPNPFNPTTTIPYRISSTGHVQLAIYDARGRLIATPVNRTHSPGRYTVQWQAQSQPSGVYFYRLSVNGRHQTRSMILLK